jgi:uncharacterized membrane protein
MRKFAVALALTGVVGLSACESTNMDQDTARRGATGAAAGAVVGGVIGSFSGNWGAGAAAGAAIGGTAGVLYDQVRRDR